MTYERELTATGSELAFAPEAAGTSTFTLGGFGGSDVVEVYNPTDVRRFEAEAAGGAYRFTDAPSDGAAYWAIAPGGYRTSDHLARYQADAWASFSGGADYVVVTAAALRASADALAAYRTSEAGGGYRVAVAEIEDLFDQFDHGRPTPIALRRFVRAAEGWARPPQFLMLWGDALAPTQERPLQPWEVISYGDAPSDGWFAMQQAGPDDWSESLAIGRVPVRDDEAGALFLEKVRGYEAAPAEAWQKRALFLAGGSSELEQERLQEPTLDWSEMAATPPTGLDTLHFFKKSTTALDPTFQDSLEAAIEEGTSWLSYFGHSAAQTWEIVTEPPRDFDNAGRLPVVLSLGCYTGNFTGGQGEAGDLLSFAEQLVLESANGGIAHWGSSNLGTITESAALSRALHERVFQDTLRTLGLAVQGAKAEFNANRTYALAVKHLLQYGLIGDPATRVALPTRPDFAVTPASIAVTPSAPAPADSLMRVDVRVRNVGLVPSDSVVVQLTHRRPGGDEAVYRQELAPFALDTTVTFNVAIDEAAVGENALRVAVDPEGVFAEESEANNEAERAQVVFSTGLTLIGPPDFGLLPRTSVTLRAAVAGDKGELPIVFQLDTAPSFDSANLREHRTTTSLLATWQPPDVRDGETYYWRARVDAPDEDENWETSAFTVREDLGKTGWLQRERLFTANEQSRFLERTEEAWQFKEYDVTATATTETGQFVINGEIYERIGLGFGLLILDGTDGTVKGHGSMPTYPNAYEDPADAFEELETLAALVAPGDYVLVRTRHLGRSGGAEIADSVKAIFRDLGSKAIDSLTYEHTWIMITQYGTGEEPVERVAPPSEGRVHLTETATFTFSFSEGQTLSPPIGPAKAWESLGWEAAFDNGASEIRVEVLAGDGEEVLATDLTEEGEVDLSGIDPQEVPFLRLRATLRDPSQRSTPDLAQWHVAYERVPDLALDAGAFRLAADTLREGATLDVTVGVANLSDAPADVAVVEYYLTNAQNETALVGQDTLRDFAGQDVRTRSLPTEGRAGRNELRVRVHQPGLRERTSANNVLLRPFLVQSDRTPPRLDVLVEGEALPNDPDPVVNLQDPALPFVPPRPTIEITIEDDDPYAELAGDSSAVTVELDGNRIPYAALDVVDADGGNELRLRFEPDLGATDTTHTLVVTVEDASGNAASPYQVHFRTQAAAEVEGLYPYPNPMSRYTVFAFRLRGRDAMLFDEFRLRIYTLTGRLVREFDLIEEPYHLEAGGLRIDWNKLRWDGRDQDGDPVATGVYLYKVFARAEGQPMRVNSADGIEKIAVIR